MCAAYVETMAWSHIPPWHGLGVEVTQEMTVDEWLVTAGLDWEVEIQTAYRRIIEDGIESYVEDPKNNYLIRKTDGLILDRKVGDRYNIIQNRDAFEVFRRYTDTGLMTMETAGSLKDGQYVWGLAKLKDSHFLVGNNDGGDGYLLMVSPHQCGESLKVFLTPIRTVCWNTLTLALNNADSEMTYRHVHAAKFTNEVMDDIERTIGLASRKMEDFNEHANFLANTRMCEAHFVKYLVTFFDPMFPAKCLEHKYNFPTTLQGILDHEHAGRTIKRVINTMPIQPGLELKTSRGTAWGAFNTVTFAFDHLIGRGVDSRLTSSWLGKGANVKHDAFTKALEYANAA